jgi:hypothetical protein
MVLLLTTTTCSVHNANVTQLVVVQQLQNYVHKSGEHSGLPIL